MQRGIGALTGALALLIAAPAAAQVAQEAVDLAVVEQIREEGLERSQLPEVARYLTEVIGPRLTGSPQMMEANTWTAEKMREWGLQNVVVEPWGEFGRGWERDEYMGRIVTPYAQPLMAQPVAWTGSTRGTIQGDVVLIKADTVTDLEQYAGQLEGAIVMLADAPEAGPEFDPPDRRTSLDDLLKPQEEREVTDEQRARWAEWRRRWQIQREVKAALIDEGVSLILNPSSRNFSVVRGGGNSAGREADGPDPTPELVVIREQYNQIYRNVEAGIPVRIEVMIKNEFFDDDLQAYNTLGDIPGGDLADEYVMLGGHLDSWHYGTGATDNAAGCVVMLEAVRILQALNLQPRRTIRIAMWSGEEQGLLGSRGWVENHPELHDRISAYVNVDNGTGKVRGIWDQSNEQVIPIFEQLLWPFRDLGVVAVKHGNTGGTDHLAFDRAGIPGFNFIQDPIEYGVRTHHTNVDTFDNLMLEDLQQAAVVVASTVYHLAMRDEMIPRKEAADATN
jgi:hypothetical protein